MIRILECGPWFARHTVRNRLHDINGTVTIDPGVHVPDGLCAVMVLLNESVCLATVPVIVVHQMNDVNQMNWVLNGKPIPADLPHALTGNRCLVLVEERDR